MKLFDLSSRRQGILKNLTFTPSLMLFYAPSWLIDEVISECGQADSWSVFSLDTTYGTGKHYATPSQYRSTKVVHAASEKPVFLAGPAMFHSNMDGGNFMSFAHSCITENENFEKLRWIGGDRGSGQRKFLSPLKGATFIPCKMHIENDIKTKIASLVTFPLTPQDIFSDVFGNDILGIKGIADSDDSSEFYEKLESRWDVWGADFYDYFHKYIAEDISSGLNPKVRRSIGLKDSYYYNNASESLNRSFKAFIDDEKLDEGKGGKPTIMSSLADTFEYYEKHVMQFRRNIQRAVFRQGPYRLTEKFRKFEIPQEAWMEKTPQERRQHLMKFDKSVKTVHSAFAEKENLIDTAASPHQNNRISQDSDQDGTSSQANLLDQSPSVSAFPTHSYQGHHMGSADHHIESNAASTVGGTSDDLSVIGDFELSGLSSIFKGSWANAGKMVLENGVGFFPGAVLPDLGFYPKILGIFRCDGIFLGIFFLAKILWEKSWDFGKLGK